MKLTTKNLLNTIEQLKKQEKTQWFRVPMLTIHHKLVCSNKVTRGVCKLCGMYVYKNKPFVIREESTLINQTKDDN